MIAEAPRSWPMRGVDRVLFHCTAATMFGPERPAGLTRIVAATELLLAPLTAHAVREALKALGAKSVVLVALGVPAGD